MLIIYYFDLILLVIFSINRKSTFVQHVISMFKFNCPIKSKQTKQELGRGEEENLWRKTKRKQTKQELGRGEETNLWRKTKRKQTKQELGRGEETNLWRSTS